MGKSLIAVYTVQYRRTYATRAPQLVTFVTVGGAGVGEWQHYKAVTYTKTRDYVDGNWIDIEPRVETNPARSQTELFPPIVPVFGGGIEYGVRRRFALRADLTVAIGDHLAFGVRGAVAGVLKFGKR